MIELKVGNKTINFRKWKVKDRLKLKNFIKERPDDTQAIATETLNCLVFDCLDTKYPLNLDEITYVFANIRKHSISDEITFEYECEMCKTKNKEIIKIDDLYKVNFSDSKEININNLKITLGDVKNIDFYNEKIKKSDSLIDDFILHIDSINDDNTKSFDELKEFFENLDTDEYDKILDEYSKISFTLDKTHKFKCKNKSCKHESSWYFDEVPNLIPENWFNR